MSNNSTPTKVHVAATFGSPAGTGSKPSTPRFVNTPWDTDPQTSRGIVTVNNPW
jgi:hypothetical protein